MASVQFLYFLRVLTAEGTLKAADAIICFEGHHGRARAAYQLAEDRYAPVVIISPAGPRRLAEYDRAFQAGRQFEYILEEKARTTFENACLTHSLVRQHGFASIILVTSWDHMPRSFFLLSMMSLGSDIRIQPYPVSTGKLCRENWYRHKVGWMMIYNELVECWGSMLEWAQWRLSGELAEEVRGKSEGISWLKRMVLFQIDPGAK